VYLPGGHENATVYISDVSSSEQTSDICINGHPFQTPIHWDTFHKGQVAYDGNLRGTVLYRLYESLF